jgi:hypothetical protein
MTKMALLRFNPSTLHRATRTRVSNYTDRAKIYLPCRLILLRAADMKCAAMFVLVSIASVSQAFAVLRPLFPAKPAPPFGGEVIAIADDSIRRFSGEAPTAAPR